MSRVAAIVLVVLAATSALAWRADLTGGRRHSFDGASSVAVLPDGDTIVAGQFDCSPALVRLDAATGAIVWRSARLTQPPSCAALAFAATFPVATDGDAVAVVVPAGDSELVMVLDAATGAERWRQAIDGGREGAFLQAIAIDRAGGVVVAGVTLEDIGEPETNFLVVSLDGSSGAERWRQVYDGTPGRPDPEDPYWNDTADAAVATGFDQTGNVLVAGTIEYRGRARWYVFQFAADTGEVRWRQRIRRQEIRLLAVDPASDEIVVAGRRDDRFGGIATERLDGAAGHRRWRRLVRGSAGFGGEPTALLVAPDGDVAVAGSLVNSSTGRDAAVVWLWAADGSVRWSRSFDGQGPGDDDAFALTLDPTGNPVLAARLSSSDLGTSSVVVGLTTDGSERWRWIPASETDGSTIHTLAPVGPDILAAGQIGDPTVDPDVLAVRLGAADGAVRWEARITGTTVTGGDAATALAVAPGGDLVAAGYTENDGTGTDFAVMRLAGGTREVRWRFEIDGERPFLSAYDTAATVTVDLDGDVVAAGSLQQGLLNRDLIVVKLDGGTAAERWRVLVSGDSDDQDDRASVVKTDAAGDVVVVGALASLAGPEMFILKLNGEDGTERWRRTVALPWGSGADVALDPLGDVVVAGAAASATSQNEFVVLKLAGDTGAERWRVNIVGTGDYFRAQAALALALTSDGDVIAAGSIDNFHQGGGGTGTDWLVVRLGGATGAERWRYVLDGPTHDNDAATGVVLDGHGRVLVAGSVGSGQTSADAGLVQLDAATGAERWRRTLPAIGGQIRITAADDGDALVTAPTSTDLEDFDVLIARLAAADGTERWQRLVSGSAPGRDFGAAILRRPDGAVVMAGSMTNTDTREDFSVVALRGSDGTDLPAP